MARPTGRPVRDEILSEARLLMQRSGASGFSYNDVAGNLGIQAPSVHHHFARKADLVEAVSADYRRDFAARVAAIGTDDSVAALDEYADLFASTEADDVLCLCAAVASNWEDVSASTRNEIQAFFDEQRDWIETVLSQGVNAGVFRPALDIPATATLFLAALEGALLLARAGSGSAVAATVAASLRGLVAA